MTTTRFIIAMFVYFAWVAVLTAVAVAFTGTQYEGIATFGLFIFMVATLVPVWFYLFDCHTVRKSIVRAFAA